MALYFYQAYTKDGKKLTGTIDASSEGTVREQLVRTGLYPISVAPFSAAKAIPFYKKIFAKGVSFKDKILFTKQLSVLLKSGVPLLQAIELLIDQFTGKLHTILIDIKDGIKEGKSFADGLSKYPKVFDTIYVQLVRAGEASGKLEFILERLVTFMERRAEMSKKVKGALRYPLIQLGFVVVVVIALLAFVVPNLAASFTTSGTKLPGTTRFIMAISDFITGHYLILLGSLIVLIAGYKWWASTATGARIIDKIKLKLPIIGYFTRMNAVVQFSSTLGILIESGVNLAESLDIVVKIIDNRILADALKQARDNIVKQGKISEYLKQTGLFPPIAIYLINTGEQSGQLDQMLLTVARNYEADLAEFADGLAASIEPIMMVVMAVVVGFIVMAIVQPMFKRFENIGQ